MDASPSPLELASRLVPERASRSASRRAVALDAQPITASVATTTTVYVVPPPTVAPKVDSGAASSATPTTVKKRTTTTRKPQPKTTTTKPPAKSSPPSQPALRESTPPTPAASTGQSEIGQATWYKTADPIVCAHKTLPMGTIVTVTNTDNGKSTTCKVGDRGPFVEGRIIDLSPESFSRLAALSEGVIDVKLTW